MLTDIMIYTGSALMLCNIIRYCTFAGRMKKVGSLAGARRVIMLPVFFLVAFLMGYLGVGLLGKPDYLVAAILLGGSIYVFLMLQILFSIVNRVVKNEQSLDALYREMKEELEQLTSDSLSVFRVNLTKDLIEERGGQGLYDTDYTEKTYTGMLNKRWNYLAIRPVFDEEPGLFTREGLIRWYEEGHTSAEEILFSRRSSGDLCFVRMEASLTQHPYTNDVIAFITEKNHNTRMVDDALLNKALAQQYDMITYLVDGRYGVVVGKPGTGRGCIFPREVVGDFTSYIEEQVAPVIEADPEEKEKLLRQLSLPCIEQHLIKEEPYEVDLACRIDGEIWYKRFSFFVVDQDARFYLLLKADTTVVRQEQIRQNEILKEALEKAQAASDAKTLFLSNMSHDIRTPMNAIIGFTNLARQSDDPQKIQDYLQKIGSSGEHLLALINDVLEMSRIESGKIELEEYPMDLIGVMETAEQMFQVQMEAKHQQFTVDCSHVQDRCVMGDRTRLGRVLLNLLSNAYKFTPEGGQIQVILEQTGRSSGGETEEETAETLMGSNVQENPADTPENPVDISTGTPVNPAATQAATPAQTWGEYRLSVKDTGIGMTPEFAEKVFDAFERERTSTVSGIQGTGLGMAITKRIVDLMHGTIEVHTAPGEGTEFVLRLRFKLSQASSEPDTETEQAPGQGAQQAYSTETEQAPGQGAQRAYSKGAEQDQNNGKELNRNKEVETNRNNVGGQAQSSGNDPEAYSPKTSATARARETATANARETATANARETTTAKAKAYPCPCQKKSTESIDFTGMRILLVEDMEINREIGTAILQQMGFEVDTAQNGAEAVEMLQASAEAQAQLAPGQVAQAQPQKPQLAQGQAAQGQPKKDQAAQAQPQKAQPAQTQPTAPYRAVLMDIQMPVMNGYEATRAIRQMDSPYPADLPIIAMTANAFREDVQAAKEAGMNDHVAKPIDIGALRAALEEQIKSKKTETDNMV